MSTARKLVKNNPENVSVWHILCVTVWHILCVSVWHKKNIIGLKKYIIYFLSNNCCDKCQEIEKNVYIYLSKTNNLKNISVWHWTKFWILARQSIEVWEVARYVFLNGMPSPLIVVKSILMNFEHIWITYFDVTHWRTVQFSGDCPYDS